MVNGIKCYNCSLNDVCKTFTKLKPFTEEARVDLGVELTFNECKHCTDINGDTDKNYNEN